MYFVLVSYPKTLGHTAAANRKVCHHLDVPTDSWIVVVVMIDWKEKGKICLYSDEVKTRMSAFEHA